MKLKAMMVLSMCLTVGVTWAAMSVVHPLFAAEPKEMSAKAGEPGDAAMMQAEDEKSQGEYGLLAIGVGLSILGGAVGTGLAQKGIGHAVVAACAENRSFLGLGIFLLALPETILIIATGLGYLLLQKIH